ncbi:MAG TPA: hypothetical protein VFG99_00830 [Chloroflexia bacterium]|nr:hypothetical protein [Chloroflexia bacterium]
MTNMQGGQLHQGSFYGDLQTADLPDDIFRAIAACQSWLRDVQRTVHPGTAEVSVQLVVPIVAHFRGGPVESLTTGKPRREGQG